MSAATYVYMVERLWDWEGSEVVAIAASLKVAKRVVRDLSGSKSFTRDGSSWLAELPRGWRGADAVLSTRTEVLS